MITDSQVLSAALTAETDEQLRIHFDKGPDQEDLTFAYWRPSVGTTRLTAIVTELILPRVGDRELNGNVAFTGDYLDRVLAECPQGCGIALLHSHLGPGWQGMSVDDVVAERDRIAGPAFGRTGFPVLGLTWGTDGSWSARFWQREAPRTFKHHWCHEVRVVGERIRTTWHPSLEAPSVRPNQVATASVWGELAQAELARTHIGIVGLGSVGSIVNEALARVGFTRVTLIDFDVLEERNLDRTAGAVSADATNGCSKVAVAEHHFRATATGSDLRVSTVENTLLSDDGLSAALDCDVLMSCVDRPWPRFVLNSLAYAHLIPVVDGGIAARVKDDGSPLSVDWRIHTIGPGHACLVCLDALRMSDVSLDRSGQLDDPDYIRGLSKAERDRLSRRNVFAFSLSVAAHEVLQLVGLITGRKRIGGTGPQSYHAYPGVMEVSDVRSCQPDCAFAAHTASAADQGPNIRP